MAVDEALIDLLDRTLWEEYADHAFLTVPPEVQQRETLRRPGASEAEIAAAERRLGIEFPPSYKAFLRISNGLYGADGSPQTGSEEVPLLFPADRVMWAAAYDSWALDLEMGGTWERWPGKVGDEFGRSPLNRTYNHPKRPPHDEVPYLRYEHKPNGYGIIPGHALHAMVIGDVGQYGLLTLNPLVASGDGEWEYLNVCAFGSARSLNLEAYLRGGVGGRDDLPTERTPLSEFLDDARPGPIHLDTRVDTTTRVGRDVRRCMALGDLESAIDVLRREGTLDNIKEIQDLSRHGGTAVHDFYFELWSDPSSMIGRGAYDTAHAAYSPNLPKMRAANVLFSAAACGAPWAAREAARSLDGDLPEIRQAARMSLEVDRSPEAGDRLVGLAEAGQLWALRALARHRDTRALLPGLRLLGADRPELRLTGAEVLRDLRRIDAVPAMLDAVRSDPDRQVTVVAGHFVAMMQVPEAAGILRERRCDPDIQELFVGWASLLEADGH